MEHFQIVTQFCEVALGTPKLELPLLGGEIDRPSGLIHYADRLDLSQLLSDVGLFIRRAAVWEDKKIVGRRGQGIQGNLCGAL